jgi:hypothetical protein
MIYLSLLLANEHEGGLFDFNATLRKIIKN